MQEHTLAQRTEVLERDENPYVTFVTRSARDEKAITIVTQLLIMALALERQAMAVVRARSRS
jgi:hypothetical protein